MLRGRGFVFAPRPLLCRTRGLSVPETARLFPFERCDSLDQRWAGVPTRQLVSCRRRSRRAGPCPSRTRVSLEGFVFVVLLVWPPCLLVAVGFEFLAEVFFWLVGVSDAIIGMLLPFPLLVRVAVESTELASGCRRCWLLSGTEKIELVWEQKEAGSSRASRNC